jgi:hypothetical protein
MQIHAEAGGRAKTLDQLAGVAVAFVGLEPGRVQQMARHCALDHLQHPQRKQQRLRPPPHRHARNDVVDQVR